MLTPSERAERIEQLSDDIEATAAEFESARSAGDRERVRRALDDIEATAKALREVY